MHYVKYVIAAGEHEGLEIKGKMGNKEIEELQRKGFVIFEYISGPITA